MQRKELESIINLVLMPIGFKKKSNSWIISYDEITSKVELQKSSYGNFYFLNYGYILNALPLDGLKMHIMQGVGSTNAIENDLIKNLLSLDNNLLDSERILGLKKVLTDHLVSQIANVKTELDVLNQLLNKKNLNDIPLIVKKYFKIEN